MRMLKIAATLMAAAALFFLAVPSSSASERNQMTEVTINQPIQIPGNRVLAAGTYWFEVPEIGTVRDNDLVLIYNKAQTHLIATLPCVPAYRQSLSGTQIVVAEQPQRSPDALLKWFYPGMHYGHAFLYSAHTQRQLDEDATINIRPTPMG